MPSFLARFKRLLLPPTAIMIAACGLWLDDEAKLARALAAMEAGDHAAAIIDLKSILQNQPEHADARKHLGLASARIGDFTTAEKALQRALDLGVSLNEFRVTLIEAKLEVGNTEEALQLADPAAAANESERFQLWLQRGDALERLDRIADALFCYEQAALLPGPRSAAWLRAAGAHRINGNDAAVRAFLDRALDEQPPNVEARLLGAILALDARELEVAERDLEVLLHESTLDPTQRGAALSNLAEARLLKGDIALARAAIEELAVIWGTEDLDVQLLRGRAALADGAFAEASQVLQSYVAVDPEPGAATALLGAALLERGLFNQAEAHLSSAIAAEPSDIEARKNLARLHLKRDDPTAARAVLREGLALAPGDDELLALLGFSNSDHGSVGRAFEAFELAKSNPDAIDPQDDAYALTVAGLAQLAGGNARQAIDSLSRVLEARPVDRTSTLNLALAYLGNNEYQQAWSVLDAAVDAEQDDLHAALRRKLLVAPYEQSDVIPAEQDLSPLINWLDDNPGDERVRALLAEAYLDRSDFAQAAAHYALVLEGANDDPVILNNLAWSYLQLEDDHALDYARRALELDSNNGAIVDTVGQALMSLGESDAGVEMLRRASLLEPTDHLISLHFAQALADTSATDEARAIAEALSNSDLEEGVGQSVRALLEQL